MSEFAFIRFLSNGLLTEEEIAKLSADQVKDILEQVRALRKKKAKEKEARGEEQSVQSYIR